MTGDAFGAMPRKLRVGVRQAFCADPAMAKGSAEKLLAEEYRTVAFSHGPGLARQAQGSAAADHRGVPLRMTE